jgi:surface-anchored protein
MQLTLDPAYPNREMVMLANGHSHLNLLFKTPGMYRVTFRVRGTLVATGQEVSSLVPFYFGVEEWQIPTAAVPVIALSGNLGFGNITVGQTATRTFTITNSGNAPLNVSSIAYPTGFSGNWSSGAIAAGASQNIAVTFAPTAAQSYGGNITVNSDSTSGTNTIAVSGTGTASAIALSGNLAFGNVPVGQTAARTLTISNPGNATLNVSGITYPARFTGNWNSGSIAAGSAINVTVTFAPSAETNYSGNITINSSATTGTNTIAASGTGTPAAGTYNAWRDTEFSPQQAADPLVSGPAADPDSDGFSNLEEFAFGGDPLVPDSNLIAPRLERTDGSWILTVRQRTNASGLTITPLATASLHPGVTDWRTDLLTPYGQPDNVAEGIDEFVYLLNGGLTERAFLRVHTQLTAP